MAIARVLIILLGAFGLIIPFIGPLFGFGMGSEPAWVVTTSRLVDHVVPGVAVILGGLMLFPHVRASRWVGATLALLGGVWLTVAPIVLGGMPASTMSGMPGHMGGMSGSPALIDILRPLVYHYGTGLLIIALAVFVLGRMLGVQAIERAETKRPAGPRREQTKKPVR
jgi:hypothetical protein